MRNVGLELTFALVFGALACGGAYFLAARHGFKKAWDEFRKMRQERLARAAGLLSPALESARLDPFTHFPEELAPDGLKFGRLGMSERPACASAVNPVADAGPLILAIQDWEDHHHGVSTSFIEALGHVAHHKLVPHQDLHGHIEPIGDALLRLIEDCPEPSLKKELKLAYASLKTGADQNRDYVARRLHETARQTHTAFHAALGHASSELTRVRQQMIQSICREAEAEIEKFMESHRGFMLNPLEWGRQTAFYREFEQLRDELEIARRAGDLRQIALIVVMIVEDEGRFVEHLHAAVRTQDELHQRLSAELRRSTAHLKTETHALTGWASQENQRLQSTVSHQLIQQLEHWKKASTRLQKPELNEQRISEWISELAKLRDQDPELALIAA